MQATAQRGRYEIVVRENGDEVGYRLYTDSLKAAGITLAYYGYTGHGIDTVTG